MLSDVAMMLIISLMLLYSVMAQPVGNQCTLYMAPSSLHGMDGFGVYTTKDLPRNTLLLNAPDGPSIPVIDYAGEQYQHEAEKTAQAREHWINLFDSYWWGRGVTDQMLLEAKLVADFQITFGSLPNHHCVLDSIDHRSPQRPYDDSMAKRTQDPGAGAFSYHIGKDFYVNRYVKAGEELFLNYGHCGEGDDHPDWTEHVVNYHDIEIALSLVERTWNELNMIEKNNTIDEKGEEEQTQFFDDIVSEVNDAVSKFNGQAASVMPDTYGELKRIMTTMPSLSRREAAMNLAKEIGTKTNSIDWIHEKGLCIDNIVPGPSNLAHAGQGAIAQRFVPKGHIVVPMPMLHILDKDVLRVHGDSAKNSTQLLMNYCFSHKHSSLLLCPITNAILINHCSNRKRECGQDGPNAEYRWASGWDGNTDSWLNKSLEELAQLPGRGLSMEIVATRDIHEGEEIYIDYGHEWEEEWEKHVATWNHPALDGVLQSYISPAELNEREGPLEMLVSGDLRKIVQHPNLFTGCIFWPTSFDTSWRLPDPFWKNRGDDKILQRYSTDDGVYYAGDFRSQLDGSYWPCSVIRSDSEDGSTYTVRIHQSKFRRETKWQKKSLPRFVRSFPRESIRFFNKPYTSDQHLQGAFRHYLGIHDTLFPEMWKDRK